MIVRPLTLRTLQYYNPLARQTKLRQDHLDGLAVYTDRHLAAIYGFVKGMSLNVEYDGPTAMAFFDATEIGRRHKMTIWREAQVFASKAIPAVQEQGYTVIAWADRNKPNADAFIKKLGGQPTDYDGEYVWPIP